MKHIKQLTNSFSGRRMRAPSQLRSIVSMLHAHRGVRAAPEEAAGTGPGGVGSGLDIHTLWQRMARERVLESRPDMSQAGWKIKT
ncbi:hypothetical protein N9174_02845 [bacterium]|nr:hypothetical protein [bacterium]